VGKRQKANQTDRKWPAAFKKRCFHAVHFSQHRMSCFGQLWISKFAKSIHCHYLWVLIRFIFFLFHMRHPPTPTNRTATTAPRTLEALGGPSPQLPGHPSSRLRQALLTCSVAASLPCVAPPSARSIRHARRPPEQATGATSFAETASISRPFARHGKKKL